MVEEEKVVKKAAKKTAVKKAAVKKAAAPIAAEAKVAVKKAAVKKAAPKAADSSVKKLSVTLVKSKHGRLKSHKACIAGLGLRRIRQTVEVIDTPENRGMINKVQYLLKFEEV